MSMNTHAHTKKNTGSRGFTLLLAALVASIVLALGTSIYEIATKEVQLSSLGRDSQFAFYAADTAAECALYWDFRYNYSRRPHRPTRLRKIRRAMGMRSGLLL